MNGLKGCRRRKMLRTWLVVDFQRRRLLVGGKKSDREPKRVVGVE